MLAPKLPPSDQARPFRVTRRASLAVEHKENLNWAVSYSDLLMVLMSFFILFFSMEDKSKTPKDGPSPLERIAMGMRGQTAPSPAASASAPPPARMGAGADGSAVSGPEAIARSGNGFQERLDGWNAKLKSARLHTKISGENLIVDFPEAVYAPGRYDVPASVQDDLRTVAGLLAEDLERVQLVVIGHADPQPLRARREFLQDNFDLSTIRALRGLRFMASLGIPEARLFAQGASSNDRGQRSISIEIRALPDAPPPEAQHE